MIKTLLLIKRAGLLVTVLLALVFGTTKAQLVVSAPPVGPNYTALVQSFFVGQGVTVTNVTYTGAPQAIGSFTNANNTLGLAGGIIMTTGNRAIAVGPNNSAGAGSNLNRPGLPELDAQAGATTYDGAVLQFDFVAQSSSVSFQYIWASEEYPEYVNAGYNDAFAFFISGPGFGGPTNIALVPNTTIPITIDNVNDNSYSQYYVNNAGGQAIQYDGFTTTMTANAVVQPCQTYTLRLVIADAGDHIYDSAVFLGQNSLSSTSVTVSAGSGYNGSTNAAYEGCLPGYLNFTIPQAITTDYTFNYNISGSAQNGVDYQTIPTSVTIPAGQTSAQVVINAMQDGNSEGQETVNVTVTNMCNVSTTTVYINDVAPLAVSAGADQLQCGNPVSATLTATPSGGLTPYSYSWSNGVTTLGATASITNIPTATTTYTVTITDACGLTATDQVIVNVNPIPTSTFASSAASICAGQPLTATYSGTANSGATYNWSVNNGGSVSGSGQGPVSITYPGAGSYVISLTVTQAGCTSTVNNVPVTVYPQPNSPFTSPATLCTGVNGTINFTGTVITGAAYTWNFAGGTVVSGSGQGPYSVNWATAGNKTISLTVAANGCTTTTTASVNVIQTPTSTFTTTSPLCTGVNGTVTYTGTVISGATYTWNFNGGTVVSGSGVGPYQVNWATAGTKNVTLTVVSNGCTSNTTTVPVIVNAIPSAAFTSSGSPVCNGQPLTVTATTTGATSYAWSVNNGATVSGSGQGPVSVSYPGPGSYVVSLAVTSNGCTSAANTSTVVVNPQPSANFTASSPLCTGVNGTISYNAVPVNGAIYTWGFNGGTVASGSGLGPYSVNWSTPGTKTVTLTVAANGCTASSSGTVVVNQMPTSSFTVNAAQFCAGANATVTFNGVVVNGANYTWNFAGGTVVSGSGVGPYQIAWTTAGVKNITLIVSANGCTSTTTTVPVNVYQVPTSTFSASATSICNGQPLSVTYSGNASTNATYAWSANNSATISGSGQGPVSVNYPGAGVYSVSLNVTENGCSSGSTSIPVTVNPQPTANFTAPSPICTGVNGTITYTGTQVNGATYTWGFNGGTVVSGTGAGPYSVNWNTPGTKTVTLNVSAAGCTASSTSSVVVNQMPTSTFSVANSQYCAGANANVTFNGVVVSGATYTWNFNGGTIVSGSGVGPYTVLWTTPGIKNITLTVSANGCTSTTTTVPVTIYQVPTSTFTASASSVCNGSPINLNYSGNASPNATYTWTSTNGGNVSGTNPFTFNYQGANSYMIGLTVAENGCSSTATNVPVTVYPIPVSTFTLSAPQLCAGANGTITYTGTPLSGAFYNWNFNGGSVVSGSGAGPYTIHWNTPGIKNVTLSITANGCTSVLTTVPVTIYQVPTSTFTASASSVCNGSPVSLNYSGNASPNATYNWTSTNGGSVSGTNPFTFYYPGANSYSIGLTVAENGCSSTSTTIPVTVYPIPSSAFTLNAAQYCTGAAATVSYNAVPVQGAVYTWNFNGGTVVSGSGVGPYSIVWNTPGTKTVTLSVSANGCTSTATSVSVTVNPQPTATFTAPSPLCTGVNGTITYTGIQINGATYTWGFNGANVVSGTNAGPYSVNWSTPGTKTVTLNVAAAGCTASSTASVVVNQMPTSTFSVANSQYCAGANATVTFNGVVVSGATYTWNFNGGTVVSGSGVGPYTIAWTTPGIKNITLTISANGCTSTTTTVPVTIYQVPTSTFTASASSVCNGSPISLNYSGNASPNATYTWTSTNGGSVSGTNPFTFNYPGANTYSIGLTVTENGCSSTTSTLPVTVYPIPSSAFSLNASQYCAGANASVSYNAIPVPGAVYTWNFNGGTIVSGSGLGPYSINWSTPGNKIVSLTVSANGCTSTTTTVPVSVYQVPTSTFTTSGNSVCDGQPVTINYTGNASPNANYNWVVNNSGSISGTNPYTLNYPAPNSYSVALTVTENGCSSTTNTVAITVKPQPTATFTSATPLCTGENGGISFTGNVVQGATYSWNFNGGTVASGSGMGPYNVNWSSPGIKNVQLNVAANGCTASDTNQVVVNQTPTSTFTVSNAQFCTGNNATVTFNGVVVNGANYAWDFDGGSIVSGSGVGPYTIAWSTPGIKNITLDVSANGCNSSTTTIPVAIYAIPTSDFATSASSICNGQPLDITYNGTASPNANYAWSATNGASVVNNPLHLNYPGAGSYNIALTVTENGCSSTSTTVPVTVYAVPTANFTVQGPICEGSSVNVIYTGSGNTNNALFAWDWDGGVETPTGNENYSVLYSTAGNYSLGLTVTENGCGSNHIVNNLVVNAIPTSTFIATSPVCTNDNSVVTYTGSAPQNAIYQWFFDSGVIASGQNQGPYDVNWSIPGTKTLKLIVTHNGCTSPQTIVPVIVNDRPTANFTVADSAVCLGQPVTLTYTGTGSPNAIYNWTTTGGATVTQQNGNSFSVGYPGPGLFNITLSVTENGCPSDPSVTIPVTIYDMPTSAFISSGSPMCDGTPLTLTYQGNASTNATYTWNTTGGATVSGTSPNYNVNYPGPGNYNISLTVSENGCTSTLTNAAVTIYQTPTSAFIASANPVCNGHPVVLTYQGNASPNANYNWEVDNGATITPAGVDSFSFNYPGAGQFIIKLVVTENACSSTMTMDTITVFDVPVSAIVAVQNPVCDGQPVILNYNGPQIQGAVYTWTTPDSVYIEESGLSSYEVIYPGAGNYSVSLKVTANGCPSDTTTVGIVVNPNPTSPFNASLAVCSGADGNIIYTGPQDPDYTYQWNFDGGNVTSGSGPGPYAVNWANAGNKEVSLIVTAITGCSSDTTSIPVLVKPIPSSSFTTSTPLCVGMNGSAYYTGAPLQNAQYSWSFDGANMVSGQFQGPYSFNFSNAGTKFVSLIVTANGCSSDTTVHPILVNPVPSSQFVIVDSTVCQGEPVTLVYTGNASVNANYSWYTTGGAIVNGTGPYTVYYPTSGTFYVTLTVTEGGCSSPTPTTVPVTVVAPPNAFFTVPVGECFSVNSYDFLAQGQFTFMASINWSFGANASPANSSVINPTNVTYDTTGTFPITLTVSDKGCTASYTENLTVYPDPQIVFSADEIRGCTPLEVQFTDLSGYNDLGTYLWHFGDGDTSSLQNPLHVYTQPGTYSVSLDIIFSSACGGSITQTALINVYPQPEAGFSVTPQVTDMFEPVVTITGSPVGATNFYYTLGDGDTLANTISGTHEYKDPNIYTIVQYVSNAFGCSDTAYKVVRIEGQSALYIPNAFTPNHDGVNDEFGAKGVSVATFKMYIFNRWGELIFTGNNLDDYWDGSDQGGKRSPNDVYIYKIYYTLANGGDEQHAIGSVSLVD